MKLTCSCGTAALTRVLLDTHTWVWSLSGDPRLSTPALDLITSADAVFVSPISFFEIAQKVRLGKWPEMDAFLEELSCSFGSKGGSAPPWSRQSALPLTFYRGLAVIHSTGCLPPPQSTTVCP